MLLFLEAILGGAMIGIGGIINLRLGGYVGALLFATGLWCILKMQFALFTGKAGLLAAKGIKISQLGIVWAGNLLGTLLISQFAGSLELEAAGIVQTRMSMGFTQCFLWAIPCGILMYIAVTDFTSFNHPLGIMLPVSAFILCGFQHSVADMFYYWTSNIYNLTVLGCLLATTLGNIVGCNIIPLIRKLKRD